LRNRKPSLSQQDIQSIIDVGEEEGVINQEEHEMIHGIFELKQGVAREVMVPRTDIKCVSKKAKIKDIIDLTRISSSFGERTARQSPWKG
jgi:magnesium and cobalt transporter